MIDLGYAAVLYAAREWPVMPLHSIRGGACTCPAGAACDRTPGKHPRTEHGLDDATTDEGVIRDWWSRWRDANIAVRCDRLFILDVDPRHGGDRYLAELEAKHGTLPATLLVGTGGGGWHHYFTAPHRRWKKTIAPGLDVQAGRGKYVLAPPSNHLSGRLYRIEVERAIAVAPDWLVDAATRPEDPPATKGQPVDLDAQLEKRVRAYLDRCPPAISGSGGHTHTLMVAQHVVRGFALEEDVAYALLSEWNTRCDPPWSEKDLRRKIREARGKGTRVDWGAHLAEDRSPAPSPRAPSPPPHGDEDAPPTPRQRLSLVVEREPGCDDEDPPPQPVPHPNVEAEPPPRISIYGQDAASFLGDEDDVDDDSQDWIVRGLILRAAPNIIAGTPKGKKTMVALHLMISIAAGQSSWLGRFPVRQGRVLVLAHEDSKRETRRRLWRLARGMGFDPRALHDTLRVADRSEPFHFDRESELKRMIATIEEWRPTTILMDSLSRMHMADENSKREMNVVTDAWLTLAARYDLAIVSVHHLVKIAETKDLILQLRGTGDIGAAVRHAVGVKRNEKDPERSRIWTDGNEPYHPEPFDISVTDGVNAQDKPTIMVELVEAEDSRTSVIEAAILSALRESPRTARQLRDACKGYRATAVDDIARAMEGKTIKRMGGDGPWRLI